MNQRALGQQGETLGEALLIKQGYQILRRNYRNKIGEIDLIAEDRGTVCFVEVKLRKTTRFGEPKEAITFAKKRKLYLMALCFLKETYGHTDKKSRFDVVTVQEDGADQHQVVLIKNAFNLDGIYF